MEYFDNVLQKNVKMHTEITPEIGVNLELKQPEGVEEYYKNKQKESEAE